MDEEMDVEIVEEEGEKEAVTNRENAFPFSFPTIELEALEDFSMCVSILNRMEHSEVAIQGVLFLTSLRLIFVSTTRIFANNEQIWDEVKAYDPSTYVEIDQIMNVDRDKAALVPCEGRVELRH